MKQEDEIDICINLINMIENYSVSNEEIVSFISTNDYLGKAKTLDNQRIEKQESDSLTRIIERIIDVLTHADTSLSIHNQRYQCSYLDIKCRLIQSCENLELGTQTLIKYLSKAEYVILQSHFTQYIIGKLLLQNDVKTSLNLIPDISEKEYHYSSYRLVADYYGRKGDKENFLKILKKCDARKDVWEMELIKSNFIEAYSEKNELNETYEIIDAKEFGSKCLDSALKPYAKNNSFYEIKNIIENSRFDAPKLYLKEIILTMAFRENHTNHTTENFKYLQELLLEIPSKVRFGNSDFSLKDNLWSSVAQSLIDDDINKFKSEINYSIKRISSKILKDGIKSIMQNRMKI